MKGKRIWNRKFGTAILAVCMTLMMGMPILAREDGGQKVSEQEEMDVADTYNLLLIGLDRRTDSWNGNSDVMILVTINPDKETIFLTSFLRDLYADIPGIGVQKLNAACANGGAALCVETLERNYQVQIDNYAMVDFNNMIAIVDALGGVDLELTESEVRVANQYVRTMCEGNQESYAAHEIIGSGLLHLDGYQAVGYMRNRYSGSENDFGRTDRQRKVLKEILKKLKECDVASLSALLLEVLPNMEHDVDGLELLSLAKELPSWLKYGLEEQRIPYDGWYHSENEILVPDMEETLERLQSTLYSRE